MNSTIQAATSFKSIAWRNTPLVPADIILGVLTPIMNSDTCWGIPEPRSKRKIRLDGNSVATLRRHGSPKGPRRVLSHGNGLAIDLYVPLWSLLADDFGLFDQDLRLQSASGHPLRARARDIALSSIRETSGVRCGAL